MNRIHVRKTLHIPSIYIYPPYTYTLHLPYIYPICLQTNQLACLPPPPPPPFPHPRLVCVRVHACMCMRAYLCVCACCACVLCVHAVCAWCLCPGVGGSSHPSESKTPFSIGRGLCDKLFFKACFKVWHDVMLMSTDPLLWLACRCTIVFLSLFGITKRREKNILVLLFSTASSVFWYYVLTCSEEF